MPIKKDGTGKRWVEMEFITPGTPEQVWQAMATGPGCAAWFTKAEIEERVGGELRFDFGPDGSSKGEVTVWDPPHHFGYIERDWNVGAPPVATEITITGRSGGRSIVRMVHSLVSSTDDWDDQMEGFESGWPGFFEVLRVYLTHFAGQRAACFMALTSIDGAPSGAWTTLTSALGLAGANVGERRSSPGEPEPLAGMIERVHQDGTQRYFLVRLEAPTSGVALLGTYEMGARVNASVSLFLYGDDAEHVATTSEPRWRTWLSGIFSRP